MILGICGSPRTSATEHVLKKALELVRNAGLEIELFTVRGKRIGFCNHCDYCLKNQGCSIQDDVQEFYRLLIKANGLIFATPVYNGGVSAQIKALMDRCRAMCAFNPQFFQGKVGMAIAVGGDRVGGQELAIQQILTFYVLNGITPISGGPLGANLGATFWSKDTLEGVKSDVEGFRSLNKTVKKFVAVLERGD